MSQKVTKTSRYRKKRGRPKGAKDVKKRKRRKR